MAMDEVEGLRVKVAHLRATLAQRDRELKEVRAELAEWQDDEPTPMTAECGPTVNDLLESAELGLIAERAAHAETRRQLADQAAVLEAVRRELGPCPCDAGFTGRDRHGPGAVCHVREMLATISGADSPRGDEDS